MARKRVPPSTVCARFAALLFGLAILGCVIDWFDDGPIGIASIVVLGVLGFLFTAASHRLSKRRG